VLERGTVLIVDDDAPVRRTLDDCLRKIGYRVAAAADGGEALKMLHEGLKPDLILLDLIMPVMTGFEVLSAIRANPDWAKIPVVVLTATVGYSAAHLDVDAMLLKPFDVLDVQNAVHLALQGGRRV
jgi:CheY-like chemotaxis protein